MSIRLNLSLLTILAAFAATIPGCGDDADGDEPGGEAGDSSTGGKATGTGGKATADAGSTGEEAGAPSTGGKSGGTGGKSSTGGVSTDAGGPSTEAGAPGEAGSTGTGGSSTGGASSTGGKTGEGGAPSGDCRAPQCLIDLAANCAPEGECTTGGLDFDPNNPPTNPEDIEIAFCWENGVKAGMKAVGTTGATFEYQKDGNTCYTAEFEIEGGEATEIIYKDASGDVVATQTQDNDAGTVTVTCEDGSDTVTYSPDDCGSGEEQPGEAPDTTMCADDSSCALD